MFLFFSGTSVLLVACRFLRLEDDLDVSVLAAVVVFLRFFSTIPSMRLQASKCFEQDIFVACLHLLQTRVISRASGKSVVNFTSLFPSKSFFSTFA